MSGYSIRPHHGLCITFFKGYGYSEAFTRNMKAVVQDLKENPFIHLVKREDDICRACPHNDAGRCSSFLCVEAYDQRVLEHCGLKSGICLRWEEFHRRVLERIVRPGKRADICGECQWNELCASLEDTQPDE